MKQGFESAKVAAKHLESMMDDTGIKYTGIGICRYGKTLGLVVYVPGDDVGQIPKACDGFAVKVDTGKIVFA